MKRFNVNAIRDGQLVVMSMPESGYTAIKEFVERIAAESKTNELIRSQAETARQFRRSKMFYRRKR
jgi:hypothetical protein